MRKPILVILLVVAAGLAAWLVAAQVRSPEQVAASAEPPEPNPVVAPLEFGYLHGPVSLSTTAQYERTLAIRAPAALAGVVTFVQTGTGNILTPGSVPVRVDGRPIFVLPGAFALYRAIQPGDAGDDVAAVQAGLRAAGYSIADRDGLYGTGTQAALSRMYRSAGFTVPESTPPSDGGVEPPAAPPGPQVLPTEILMVPELPATVQSVASVGTQLTAETDLAVLGAGAPVLSATIPASAVGALVVGATGTFTDAAGAPGTAQVSTIAPNADATESVVTLAATGAVTTGAAYVVMIANPAGEAAETLLAPVAPVAAVVARAERSYLYVREGATFREVEVQVVGSVGGVAAIVPVDPATALEEGTEVRVG